MMLRSLAIAAVALTLPLAAQAETPEEKGLRIATEAKAADAGFGDYDANGEMTLRNKSGKESIRGFSSKTLEQPGDGDKSLMVFKRPRDIKGTALLTHAHKAKNDDQWLYLPAMKRVKRISSSNRSGSFVGSEFSYEDLSSPEVEKYTYKYLKEEPCPTDAALTCHVSERYPTDKTSGYKKNILWLETKTYRVVKIDYFDRKDAFLKTLTQTEYNVYKDKHWRPHLMEMVNHQTGKSTTMKWSDFKFGVGLSEGNFQPNRLKSVR
ncbi:outer membrane lipoprotein-sorting protein [Magnetospira sp. QH-2]|uniref:outer membrane lipoprotein-sorting protein n=1 Tax=Magnetospira sp. (strain QH-2) TaxID=1288970 RepID=UPI000A662040|nr:outer membrane lipoprotein-sorting protein [Magnetospira sp. QH-2]